MNQFYKTENPHRLYRDKHNAMLAGVCAGLADYFDLSRKGLRIAVVLMGLFPPFFPFVVLTYIILAIILPVKPEALYNDDAQADFWRGVSNAPSDVFGAIRHRFRELNQRLEKMEAYVTSREFEIDRELSR
ncbi:MAG: envelope stress response membrane protein PspC [Xanthomonadales bacterium]|nr:envelope stress response membrane protein PspC [Xanthomonadales bacterium]